MALYAFDGTWSEDEPDPADDSNVVKFRDAYDAPPQSKVYIQGVGTRFGSLGRIFGGLFGTGGRTRIEEMYESLVENWRAGDRDIDVIGFSRGASLGIHFTNVIDEVGILVDGETVARPNVRFLGIWDTVGSFGIPINLVLKFQEIDIGYDLVVPDSVEHCYHALALNERRQTFKPIRQDRKNQRAKVTELWFRGVHGDIGGDSGNAKLSNIPLQWMMTKAKEHGLPIDQAAIERYGNTDPLAPVSENLDPIKNDKRVVQPTDQKHSTAIGKLLGVGESASFTVHAEEQYSWSGVRLEAGGFYSFHIAPGDTWQDGDIGCGPEGWATEELPWYKEALVELAEGRRRCPRANWFELIGAIGDDEEDYFRIGAVGADATYEAPAGGELFAFPNDLRSMYGNNVGDLTVTVRREPGPGARRLKACGAD